MTIYRHRPEPSGLHAKMVRELSAASDYVVIPRHTGQPNHIIVYRGNGRTLVQWAGHRDAMPSLYRGAQDPQGLLSRPSSD